MIRWGIAGTGSVSALFAEAVAATDGGEVRAVASRDPDRADRFAADHGIYRGESYESLAATDIDAVYVGTPPALHCSDTLRYLDAGKHVLCEKPLAMSSLEALAMRTAAQKYGLFLMEAMWCRFLPAYTRLRQLLAERFVGDVVMVDADMGIMQPNRDRNEFNAALGGGALLTGGMYAVQLAQMVCGTPMQVQASGHVGESGGVDEWSAAVLEHADGSVATVRSSVVTNLACSARICGTEGTITLPSVHSPQDVADQSHPFDGPRLRYEVAHVQECIEAGLTESPVMPLGESVAIAGTIDKIRAQL